MSIAERNVHDETATRSIVRVVFSLDGTMMEHDNRTSQMQTDTSSCAALLVFCLEESSEDLVQFIVWYANACVGNDDFSRIAIFSVVVVDLRQIDVDLSSRRSVFHRI